MVDGQGASGQRQADARARQKRATAPDWRGCPLARAPDPQPNDSSLSLFRRTPPLSPSVHLTSEYLLVMHEPRASMTGADVKFPEAISSMPFLC